MENPSLILHQVGLRCTPKRIAILQVLLDSSYPLTHREIESLIPPDIHLNYVSLYRALESFLEVGIVHRVLNEDRTWRFAFCGCRGQGHCHPHFICRGCGKVECLSRVHLPLVSDSMPGYVVEEREMYLKGLCTSCSAEGTSRE